MSTTALGIAPDDNGNGVTPVVHRLCQMAQWEKTGVVQGLTVTSNDDLSYTVAPGIAITTRGNADGYAIAYSEGGDVDTIDGDTTYARYDVVYIKSNDLLSGDGSNHVELGCVNGDAASVPEVPTVGEGCTVLDTFYVPAGSTAASDNTTTNDVAYASPLKSFCGTLATSTVSDDQTAPSSKKTLLSVEFYVPTERSIEVRVEAAPVLSASEDEVLPISSAAYVYVSIDGETVTEDGDVIRGVFGDTALTDRKPVLILTTEVSEGHHTCDLAWKSIGDSYASFTLAGATTLSVIDMGLVG